MATTITIVGGRELQTLLTRIEGNLKTQPPRIIKEMGDRIATLSREVARSGPYSKTGRGAGYAVTMQSEKTVVVKPTAHPLTGKVKSWLTVPYGQFLEFGTKPHLIPTKYGIVHHPGARPLFILRNVSQYVMDKDFPVIVEKFRIIE